VTEALKYLPNEAEAKQLHARTGLLETERKELQEKFDTLKKRLTEANGEIEQCLTDIDSLRSAIDNPADEDDLILFSPRGSRKRPTRETTPKPSKRMRRQRDDDSEDSDST
jgi:chromosome segregation ATPase